MKGLYWLILFMKTFSISSKSALFVCQNIYCGFCAQCFRVAIEDAVMKFVDAHNMAGSIPNLKAKVLSK